MVTRKILGILMLLFCGTLAFASDHIKAQAFFEDTSGSTEFEQLPQNEFQPYAGILNRGYTPSTYWIRLHIDPEGTSESLILRIRPNYLDEIVLYDPEFGSLGQETRGDEQSTRDRYESLNLNFSIPSGSSPRDVWLRIKTGSTLLLSVEALDPDEATKADSLQQLKFSFYLATIGLFMAWGVVNAWGNKDRVIVLFSFKQATCLLYMAGLLGYVGYFWPKSWTVTPGIFVDIGMGPYGAVAFWFEYTFLRDYRPNRYLLSLLRWLPAFLPVYVLLLLVGESQWAFTLCMSLFVIAPVLTFLIVLTIPPFPIHTELDSVPILSRKTLVVIYGCILLGLSCTTLPAMGMIKAGSMIFDSLLLYSLINGFAILIVLLLRTRMRERQRVALEIQNREVKKQFETERLGREEQAQFMAMLTHELRTPLTAIRMSLSATDVEPEVYSEATQSIEEMKAILDRCLTTDQLDLGKVLPQREAFWVGREVSSLVKRSADPSRLFVEIGDDVRITSDVVLFRLATANLIDNALKYAEKSSIIHVMIEPNGAQLFITIKNLPGKAGWPDPERLFQKYYRSPSAQQISGTGLGLYLTHQLSRSLGGSLRYAPSVTHIGFTLCLPL